jgi:uncharacterized membrane protein
MAPAWILDPLRESTRYTPRRTVLDFVVFALTLMGFRLVSMWVVNNTRGSVFMAILAHASWNSFYAAALIQLFPTPAVLGSYLNLTMAAWALALVLIAVTRGGWATSRGPTRLSRHKPLRRAWGDDPQTAGARATAGVPKPQPILPLFKNVVEDEFREVQIQKAGCEGPQ